MKNKTLSYILIALFAVLGMGVVTISILTVGTGSLVTIVSSSGEQPTPVAASDSLSPGYQPVNVNHVDVEVGVGSPIPVKAIVSGDLPNSCAQLGEMQLHRDGTQFIVQLVAFIPKQTNCNSDTIPYRLEIPLNIVNLPPGQYSVNVNGVTTNFDLDAAAQ